MCVALVVLSGVPNTSDLVSARALLTDCHGLPLCDLLQLVKVLQDHDTTGNKDWWLVCLNDGNERGYVPASYLEELDG